MSTGEDRNKNRFKNWKLCGFENSRFATTEQQNSRRTVFSLPIRVSISLFRFPSHVNTTLRYLNVSTCCRAFPLTCRIHCLGRLERHNTSIFSVLIFVPAWSHAELNRSNACWSKARGEMLDQMRADGPVEKIHACSTNSSAQSKANGLSCSFQLWHLRRRVCDCLSNSYRPGLYKYFGRGPHKLLHDSLTSGPLA